MVKPCPILFRYSVERKMFSSKLQINIRGATRTVFLTKKYAIKVPTFKSWKLFLNGLLSNLQEREFCTTKWPELCPVLFSDPLGFIIIMPYAQPLDKDFFYDLFDYDSFTNKGDYIVPVENKLDSFGSLDGQIVAVDYGS